MRQNSRVAGTAEYEFTAGNEYNSLSVKATAANTSAFPIPTDPETEPGPISWVTGDLEGGPRGALYKSFAGVTYSFRTRFANNPRADLIAMDLPILAKAETEITGQARATVHLVVTVTPLGGGLGDTVAAWGTTVESNGLGPNNYPHDLPWIGPTLSMAIKPETLYTVTMLASADAAIVGTGTAGWVGIIDPLIRVADDYPYKNDVRIEFSPNLILPLPTGGVLFGSALAVPIARRLSRRFRLLRVTRPHAQTRRPRCDADA